MPIILEKIIFGHFLGTLVFLGLINY